MKKLFGNILTLMAVLLSVGISSCVSESYDETTLQQPTDGEGMWVRLRVNTLDAATSTTPERELMHTLRVVLLNEKGDVEYNHKESFATPVSEHYFNVLTTAGEKTFFLIANEGNINIVNDDNETTTPLSDILNRYIPGLKDLPPFETLAESLRFDKSYFEDPSNPIPLSSRYDITAQPGIHDDFQFYLVRTATKYTVHFDNYRSAPLEIKNLYISQLKEMMYLMPHVRESQQTISGLPWIDWLKQVSDESNLPENNQGDSNFNLRYGWIKDYDVPSGSDNFNFYLIETKNDKSGVIIPAKETTTGGQTTPGTIEDLGPFYSTEGLNLKAGTSTGVQEYGIHIDINDLGKNTEFSDSQILPNLEALFRNSHVIINIRFDEFYMHIYAEIENWDRKEAYGNVTEEK